MSTYTVKICISKINEESGKQEAGASAEANQLSFEQAAATIADAKPKLDAVVAEMLAKDVE